MRERCANQSRAEQRTPRGHRGNSMRAGRDDDGRRLGSYVRTFARAYVSAILAVRVLADSRLEPVSRCPSSDTRRPEVGRVRFGLGQPSKAARRVQRSMHGNVLADEARARRSQTGRSGRPANRHAHRGAPGSANCMGHTRAAPTLDDGTRYQGCATRHRDGSRSATHLARR